MGKDNCWDYLECDIKGDCPAYPDNGRVCFSVTGTFCRGETQGTYREKIQHCREQCDYYKNELTAAR